MRRWRGWFMRTAAEYQTEKHKRDRSRGHLVDHQHLAANGAAQSEEYEGRNLLSAFGDADSRGNERRPGQLAYITLFAFFQEQHQLLVKQAITASQLLGALLKWHPGEVIMEGLRQWY